MAAAPEVDDSILVIDCRGWGRVCEAQGEAGGAMINLCRVNSPINENSIPKKMLTSLAVGVGLPASGH